MKTAIFLRNTCFLNKKYTYLKSDLVEVEKKTFFLLP